MKYLKALLLAAGLGILFIFGVLPLAGKLIFSYTTSQWIIIPCLVLIGLLYVLIAFFLKDKMFPQPRPSELSTDDFKRLWNSGIIWACLINLGIASFQILFDVEFDVETQEEIRTLDWKNLTAAIASFVGIVLRKTDLIKRIL